jgi:hypothetical protein
MFHPLAFITAESTIAGVCACLTRHLTLFSHWNKMEKPSSDMLIHLVGITITQHGRKISEAIIISCLLVAVADVHIKIIL